MPKTLLKQLRRRVRLLPTCLEYRHLLETASAKTGLTIPELRSRYGLATYDEWATVLGIK